MMKALASIIVLVGTFFIGFSFCSVIEAQQESVTIINPQNNPRFKKFLDEALLDIMSTDVGRAVCAHILGGNVDLIEKHIGVSTQTALAIKGQCASRPAKQISYIHPSTEEELVKISESISKEKREYFFVFNLNKPWPMDSWTDPIGNRTYLILQKDWIDEAKKSKDSKISDSLSILLYQMLAHELAIYFDPKHFPGGADWDRLGIGQFIQWPQDLEQLDKVYSALMNPMIASALAFLRAFQIERLIMIEIAQKKGFALPAEYKNEGLFDCRGACLASNIRKIAMKFSSQSATLFALSPQYRNRLMTSSANFSSKGVEEYFKMTVEVWPKMFFDQFKKLSEVKSPWVLLLPTVSANQSSYKIQNKVSFFITNYLFPMDYTLLANEYVVEDGATMVSVLEFMTRPLLSGYNVRMSTGPRIRIRGGDIR